ncbi:MAG: DUF222 domain-containing protein [Thermoleophilaceae bacterium]
MGQIVDVDQLAAEICTLSAHISAATARFLVLVAQFYERGGWGGTGAKTCAHWLSWTCGLSLPTAREHVRVAQRLRDFPLLTEAFSRGELSYSQMRALTRIEDVGDERELLDFARAHSAAQLEQVVRSYRRCATVDEAAQDAYDGRSLHWWWEDDGSLMLKGRLPAEQGALLVQALEAARDALGPPPPEDVSAEARRRDDTSPVQRRNADALVAVAGTSLDEVGAPSTADRYQVVVHVDVEALQQRSADEGEADAAAAGRCDLEGARPLPAEAVRRLACDGSVVRILERDGEPLSIGRKTRTIPPALRRVLRSRDGGCMFPGCTTTRHVDAHHIEHWADGGRTDLDNLVELCRHHHRLLHEGGFSVRRRGEAAAFFAPDGRHLPHSPTRPRGDCAGVVQDNWRRRVNVSAETPLPADGGRMDLGLSVDALIDIAKRRRE